MPKGILNKASLVMVPEAPIDGTMPSVFPEDRSGDFTFTRGSNLAATRVASNGLIEKGRENLLVQSNQFDTTWTNYLASVTSGQPDKDGGSDAWLLSKSGASGRLLQNISNTNVSTYSIYAKAGTLDWILLFVLDSSVNPKAYFDLSNGTIGTNNDIIDSNIEDVGNGWYRCSITYNKTITQVRVFPADEDNDTSGTSGSIYIQDAQLEVGLVATGYIESGATTGKAGLLENEPRIDFTGGGCGSLLLEPQRTNLVTQSEYFGAWNEQGTASVTNNQAVSPEGVQNAALLDLGATSGGFNRIDIDASISAGTDYVFSVFVKNIDVDNISISNFETGNYLNATFDLVNVIKYSSSTSYIEDYGNDWWRVSLVFSTNTATTASLRIQPSLNGSYPSQGEQFYIYGATLELGSYPTSYIPTHGNIVTRSQDVCNGAGDSSLFESTQGVLFYEGSALNNDGTNRFITLSDGTNDNRVLFGYRAVSNQFFVRIEGNNSASVDLTHIVSDVTNNIKFAISYDSAFNYNMFVNGVLVNSNSGTNSILGLNDISFTNVAGTENFFGKMKQLLYFPTALTDEECSALTQP